eukprot:CAMPEP_0114436534 /NCGR_PEP_ID=MMETSP0103-20121206/13510_1 /TAXON_ID=37642 ORGANISM="Paraphysomonas imperforata, Strain PA2" /NCGR_SAMPLE_ID=MMETSP0103 /ASSEMBLY_ACC=CAM_ASM_000201 /LENGTH=73 /DNA_ID=CAMNT_0001606823 /DNA_START=84 /DNA_END=302 /DNA_ORIENTATION=+
MYGGQSSSSVMVLVVPSEVVAVIAGGRYQSWRVDESALTLDGSDSYDLDIGPGEENQYLNYSWSCDQSQSPVA